MKLDAKLLGSLEGLQENKALKGIGLRAAVMNLPIGHLALHGAQRPLRCCPTAVPAWTPKSHHSHSPHAAETTRLHYIPNQHLDSPEMGSSTTAALILPGVSPGCSQAPTLQHPAPSPTDTVPATVSITPITNFSLPTFVSQLFGFVYACYVSKVFLEEEDSCKLWQCRESCRMAKWPWLTPSAQLGTGQ